MGGAFSPQQTPTQVVDNTPAALGPFREQLIRAFGGLVGNPAGGVTPLEEGTIRGAFQQAEPARNMLDQQVRGQYLPGQAQGNPFLSAFQADFDRGADISRRQLAAAAQRSGALSSTDYTRQASDLEANLAAKRGSIFGQLYESERGRQNDSVGQLGQLAQGLLGMAAHPRNVATAATYQPLEYALRLLSSGSSSVIPGKTSPSPFASLLSAAAQFVPLF